MQRNALCKLGHNSRTYATHRTRIKTLNPSINAFISISPSPTQSSSSSLPLENVTVAVKDNISTSTLPTTCASSILKTYIPPYDATVVRLLNANGADVIGKTNCDEFGMGSLNIHSAFGSVKNPTYLLPKEKEMEVEERSAGGSSGGSAAAVAAGLCDAALGTDTGGSIRLPASYCGVVGFKPSYGLVSRWGVISYADSLDCVGVLAKDVEMVQRVFGTLNQYDPRDPTSTPEAIRAQASSALCSSLGSPSSPRSPLSILRNLRIGIPSQYFPSELAPSLLVSLSELIFQLRSQGAQIVPVSLPHTKYALSAYYVLASAEASSNLARFDGVQYGFRDQSGAADIAGKHGASKYALTRTRGFGKEVQKRIMLGTYALSAGAFENYFLQAQRIRQMVRDDFDRVFKFSNFFSDCAHEKQGTDGGDVNHNAELGVDVVLHPSAIRTAPNLGEKGSKLDAYVQDVLTVPASLGGLPALSVPMNGKGGEEERGVPVGVSVVGQWGTDQLVLDVGKAIDVLQNLD